MTVNAGPAGPAASAESSWRYRGWRVAAAAMASLMFGPSAVAMLSFGIFIHPIEQDFGWTRAEVAIASSICAYTAMFVSPLHGYLVDRFGARAVLLPCVPLFALAVAAMYFLPPIHWVYWLAWIGLPLAGLGMFPLSYIRLVSAWFDRRLGRAIGIANAGIGLGAAMLPLVLTPLIRTHGWRWGFLAMAALVLLVSLPAVGWFVREPPGVRTRRTAPRTDWAGFFAAMRTPRFVLLGSVFVLLGLVNTALAVHQIPLLLDAGVGLPRAAAVQTVFGVFVILGRLATGALIDFLAAPLVLTIWVLGATAACLLYACGVSGDLVFVCGALLGMMIGAEFDVLGYLLKRYFDLRLFGKLHGVVYAVFQFGAGAGAALLPAMRQASGSYRAGLLVFAGITVAAAALLLALNRVRDGAAR